MKKAAIVGGGVIGGGWAARFCLMGWDVAVHDPDPDAPRKVQEVMEHARWALPMLYDRALPEPGNLHFAGSIGEAVKGADYIQESVPERLSLKHAVYSEIEVANAEAPLGSSTSGFKPSELAQGLRSAHRLFVAHPFNPVYLLPLVEIVPGEATGADCVNVAVDTFENVGFFPLRISREIDAHVADRFLEAVWREALWLVRDGVATTEEIDNAIRYGFGLRWAQMGLFETYRIAGGEGGMAHFLAQFGPALKWPWTKLMDVPDLDDALVQKIAGQSDAQSGHMSIRELERLRDTNLVAMLRALKARGNAAGGHLAAHEATLPHTVEVGPPMVTQRRVIPIDWTDYNGHMNESRYGQVFSDAADAVMVHVGADAAYIAAGNSFFTVETTIKYLAETLASEAVHVCTEVMEAAGKKLRLRHEMRRSADDAILATCDQLLIHVSLETRRSSEPLPEVADRMAALAREHGA